MDHCIRILLDNLCKICVSGSLCEDPLDRLYQDPAGALVQDLCFRLLLITCISLFKISCGPLVSSLRSTCASRPLLRGSCKTTCAKSLYEDPVRQLVQDLCFRILILLDHLSGSCSSTSARSLSQDLCMRIILDHLYQDLVGPLVQDLCIRILWTACVGIL